MNAEAILNRICSDRGINSINEITHDFVPFNDLATHKTEVWSLSLTNTPEDYFARMNKKFRTKTSYCFNFPVTDVLHGIQLCEDLSCNCGMSKMEIPVSQELTNTGSIFLSIHIHPEFAFTPNTTKAMQPTQELKFCFF